MTSPVARSVTVRLAMDTSSYIAGASRAEASTLTLDRAVQKVGPSTETSMARASKSAGAAEGALGKLNKSAGALGFTLGGLAGVGAAVAAALSVKWAGDYQSALTRLSTTAGESQKNLGMVGKGLLDMAGQVGVGADELAKGMYTVESGGFHGANGLTVMKAAAQGARQEQADLGKVTDAVTTILHDYHLKASDASTVTSQLVTAVSHGKTTFDELTGALHSVTPLAAKMGISIADVTGTLAAMTASGESADQATQNMANTLQHLASPTSTMINELAQLGVSTDDLQKSLSAKGLAGTLQMVEEAIVNHVDPATQRVLLPALNQSKTAVQDLNVMLGQMPPSLAKLSQGLVDGQVSFSDYRKAVQDLGGPQSAMGKQFLSLFQSSQGFNNVLKAGGPAAQVFTAAMSKAFGTTAALNVALQTTGENAASTNAAIKDIGKASGDAQGNIKGWSEVQGNFNQQLAQSEAHAKSMAIEAGQHLLPALTDAFGYVNRDALPGLEHLGSGAADVAHWFGELPAPIKDTALAMGALKLATAFNFLGINTGAGALKTTFVGLREEMAVQQALWAMNQRAAGATAATYGETTAAIGALTIAEEAQTARLGAMNAAASTVAARGFAGMKAAGSGLISMFGGPWGIALVGATLGVTALMGAIEKHDEQVKKATQDVLAWNKAIALGDGGQSAVQAAQHLDTLRGKIAELQQQIDAYNAAAQGGYARGGIGSLLAQQRELQGELDKGSKAWKDQLAAMTPVEEAQSRVDIATKDLNDALKHNPPNAQAVTNASMRLHDAQASLAGETERANAAAKTQIQRMQDQANAALGLLDAQRAAQVSQLQLADAIDQYNKDATDGQHTTRQLQEEQLGVVDSARQAAQAAADAAAAQAKQNGATDTGTASQGAFLKSLQDTANKLTGPAREAVLQMIAVMGDQQGQAVLTAGAINSLGITVTDLPNEHMITIDVPTDAQMQKLHDLGYATATLPNGKIVVSADTNPAIGEIQDLLNYARQQSINYRATLPDLNGSASGNGRMGTYAAGGWVRGPGTGTSDSVPIMGSNGEFMVRADRAQANAGLLEDINAGRVKGYAGGGWIGVPPGGWYAGAASVPVQVQDAGYKAGVAALAKQLGAAAPGAPTSVQGNAAIVQSMAAARGWTGAEWNALYALVMRESGFRNTAQNPTSTAYGMFQFLNSTWAGYGLSKTSDPRAQTRAGLDYIAGRYRDPLGAWAHETRFGWYDGGGKLMPGATLAMNGTGKPETVRTAEQEDSVQRVLRTREMPGAGFAGMVASRTDARQYVNNITAGPSGEQIAKEIMRAQYVQDFLRG